MVFKVQQKQTDNAPSRDSRVEMLSIQNNLLDSLEHLNGSVTELKEALALADNIHSASEFLSEFPNLDAIHQLNTDKGLESLMGVPEKLITVEKAVEALDDQKSGIWDTIKQKISEVWKWLAEVFRNAYDYIVKKVTGRVDTFEEAVNSFKDDEVKAYNADHPFKFYLINSNAAKNAPTAYIVNLLTKLNGIVHTSARNLGTGDVNKASSAFADIGNTLNEYGFTFQTTDGNGTPTDLHVNEAVEVTIPIGTKAAVAEIFTMINNIVAKMGEANKLVESTGYYVEQSLKSVQDTDEDATDRRVQANLIKGMANTLASVITTCTKLANLQIVEFDRFINGIIKVRDNGNDTLVHKTL